MDIHVAHNRSRMSDKLLHTFYKVELNHWWWVGRKKIILNLLKKYIKSKKNIILDAGCGTGAEINYLKKFGTVYGLDLSSTAVQFCKKRGIKNIKTGDISNMPYKENYFDLVFLMDVLEHTSNNLAVLKEIHRVLKPDGILVMTIPALPFIYSKHDRAQGHFKRYSKGDVQNITKKAHFKELKVSYFNLFLSPPIILIRLISKIGGIFGRLADFDSQLNYDILYKKKINMILGEVFAFEGNILQYVDLPFGISLITIHEK